MITCQKCGSTRMEFSLEGTMWVQSELRAQRVYLRCMDCGNASIASYPPAPHVKVTEVTGTLSETFDEDGDPVWLLSAEEDEPGCYYVHDLEMLSPDAAKAEHEDGPRGRFRITVEFWPEEKP